MSVISTSTLAIIFGALLASCVVDLKKRIIPDEMVLLVAMCGLCACLYDRPSELWMSLLIAAGLFAGLAVCCHLNWLGGGDVKLMSALSLAVPADQVTALLVEISVAGAILCCAYLAAGSLLRTFRGVPAVQGASPGSGGLRAWVGLEAERMMASRSVPYALAIFGGFACHAV